MSSITRDDVLRVLSRHIGADTGISVITLTVLATRGSAPCDAADQRRVRQLIEELRTEGHHICAHPSTGYYIAATDKELTRTCEYLYRRALTSLRQVAAMRRVSLPDLRGQLRLPPGD